MNLMFRFTPIFSSSYCNFVIPFAGGKGHAVAHLVETLHYKPEGRGSDSRWCH